MQDTAYVNVGSIDSGLYWGSPQNLYNVCTCPNHYFTYGHTAMCEPLDTILNVRQLSCCRLYDLKVAAG